MQDQHMVQVPSHILSTETSIWASQTQTQTLGVSNNHHWASGQVVVMIVINILRHVFGPMGHVYSVVGFYVA
jgi:hypothetical protein